jgi:hypothetical protein
MAMENDIVLIYFENQPTTYARIESILPDHKPDWYHVGLLLLQIPLQTVTWILRDNYINGMEFTMAGKKIRLEKVVSPDPDIASEVKDKGKKPSPKKGAAKVISLKDLKKK